MPLSLAIACSALTIAQPLVGAHRGLVEGELENTLHAFNRAIETGVDIIELDLRSSADGKIVIMHDKRVDRTTNGTGAIAKMTIAQIRQLDTGAGASEGSAGEPVPTYDEALQLAKAHPVRLLLDVKNGRRLDLREVIRKAKEQGVADRVVIGIRRLADLREAKSIDPDINVLAFVSNRSRIDAFIAEGADYIRLWSDWVLDDEDLIEAAHRKGKRAWVLVGRTTPQEPAALQELHERLRCTAPDAIITDTPGMLHPGRQ